jgi:Domain of unknown function DUF11
MPRSQSFLAWGRGRRGFTLVVLAVLLGFVPSLVGGGSAFAQGPARADMAIAGMSDNPDPVLTYQTVTYFVSVENRGPSQATGVELSVRFEPDQSNPACTESGGLVTCSFASWPANAAAILLIAVTLPPQVSCSSRSR